MAVLVEPAWGRSCIAAVLGAGTSARIRHNQPENAGPDRTRPDSA
jgi:hypothetical protein